MHQAAAERKLALEAAKLAQDEIQKLENDLAEALAELVVAKEESQRESHNHRDADRAMLIEKEEAGRLKIQVGTLQSELRVVKSSLQQAEVNDY